jgi:hypothetical protein
MFDATRGDEFGDAVDGSVRIRSGDGLERVGEKADVVTDRHPDPDRAVIDPKRAEENGSGHGRSGNQ